MKQLFQTFICFLLPLFFPLCIIAQQPHYVLNEIVKAECNAHTSFFNPPTIQAVNNYNITFHRIDLQLDPAVFYLSGNVTTCFIPDVNLDSLEFDLTLSLTVDSVLYHNAPIIFSQLPGGILRINFPATISAATPDSLTVYYKGAPSSTGFGSFMAGMHGTAPVMWTLSEPYGAKDWWPCKQNLKDKIDSADIIITTPLAYCVASNGILADEDTVGATIKYHWKTRYPTPAYLIAFAVSNYTRYTDWFVKGNDSLEILNYVYPENYATAITQTPEVLKVMKLFDSLLVEYPFKNEKYGHAQFNWGGGMEHQTMSFMGSFNKALIAHELAHQWFGDKVTCGSWHDIWLNEGFATYFEGLVTQHYETGNWHTWLQVKKQSITGAPGGSVYCDDTTTVSRIFDGRLSYSKGAYVLHMLRWTLGDSLFFQSLQNYLNDASLAYNFATTNQLKYHLENTSGKNLSVFFDQWYYKQGYPTYDIKWSYKNGIVTVVVNQTQSHASVDFFEMLIPVEFRDGTNDTILILNNTQNAQTFTIPVNFEPAIAEFDPQLWILSGNNKTSKITPLDDEPGNIHFYPNPVLNDIINVELINYYAPLSSVELIDALGRTLLLKDYSSLSLTKAVINMQAFTKGVYFIKVKVNDDITIKKIIKWE